MVALRNAMDGTRVGDDRFPPSVLPRVLYDHEHLELVELSYANWALSNTVRLSNPTASPPTASTAGYYYCS